MILILLKFWLPIKNKQGIVNRNLVWSIGIAFLSLTFSNATITTSEEEYEIEICEYIISTQKEIKNKETKESFKISKEKTHKEDNKLNLDSLIFQYTQKLYILFCQLSIDKCFMKKPSIST